MCVGQVNTYVASPPDIAKFAGEPDQRVLIAIMLRHNSARKISRRLHMSGMRFKQIEQTGILTDKMAKRLNSIEGVNVFKANHPRMVVEQNRFRVWNGSPEHKFKPDSLQFQMFAEYFISWAYSGRKLMDRDN